MSNQIDITGGARVRGLNGVITGTSGVLTSVPLGGANGVATLDATGKVPSSQLPTLASAYKGTWNASTNTPTIADGTGTAGDYYLVSVAGTQNLGSGSITFAVGNTVIYSGTIWQKSGTAAGVTSVGLSTNGGAITIGSSPVTSAGTITANFNGTNLQYVNGAGNLTTFPTLLSSVGLSMPSAFSVANSPLTANGTIAVTGAGTTAQYIRGDGSLATFPAVASEAQRLITEVYNSTGATLTKGTVVYINGGQGNLPTVTKALATGDATSAQTYGVVQTNISNMSNGFVVAIGSLTDLDTQAYAVGTQLYLSSTTAGAWTSVKQYAPAHLVYVAIVVRSHPTQGVVEVRIQNGFEMDELHDVSAQTPSNGSILQYVTSTGLWTAVEGTTTNIAQGTNLYYTNALARTSISLTTTGTSGASTYNNTTGVFNIPAYTLAGLGGQPQLNGTGFVKASGTTITYDNSTYLTTSAASSTYLPLAGGTLTGSLGIGNVNQGSDGGVIPRLAVANPSNIDKFVGIGYDDTGDYGFIHSIHRATAWKNLAIQAFGGNVLIGTTTNAGYKLDVNGTGRFTGAGKFNSAITGGAIIFDAATNYGLIQDANSVSRVWFETTGSYRTLFDLPSAGTSFAFRTSAGTIITSITSAGAASFSSSVTATSFFESSDSRLKTLIEDNYQTKGIGAITPKLYTKNGRTELGYYAQDFVGVLDSAVSKGEDEMLSLSYREVLVAKIYAMEERIKELEAKFN